MSIGDTMTAKVTVRKRRSRQKATSRWIAIVCTNQRGETVITGTAYTRRADCKRFDGRGSHYRM